MATYNGGRYLREQIDSILDQTIPFHELIISDDASTDGTWDILTEYAARDPRIKACRNERNIGFVANFEKALRHCSGDYIALSDQDDVWTADHLEALLHKIEGKNLAVGDAEIMDTDGLRTGVLLSHAENWDYIPKNDLLKAYTIFFYRGCAQGASMLFKKEFLAKALPVPNNGIYHDVWLNAFACFYGGMQRVGDVITLYRRHDKAVTGAKVNRARILSIIIPILSGRALSTRWILVPAIRERLDGMLSQEQCSFLNEAEKYYSRRRTLFGRIRNLPFELKHYQTIYSSYSFADAFPWPSKRGNSLRAQGAAGRR